MAKREHIALFGGTFDPVHIGHLRSAIEVREALAADELCLLPNHQPPLRGAPGADSRQRLAMVEAAVAPEPGLNVDARELRRDEPSYTVDTLRELRGELGAGPALTVVIGSDAFNNLHHWQQWRELFSLAHLLVLKRPGHPLSADDAVRDEVAPRRLAGPSQFAMAASGGFYVMELIQLPISATDIRRRVAEGKSIRYLVPEAVAECIDQQDLYR
ncbi:nicotinate-nucleotide adenylyltransferase [Spongiibacter nanhainus]|uniref:Probable nicotinate-nucleotide adenylyltransferase n=1 Tax=Spongiibacter nanhainus TaxID=2794344 RepID=A0A7T4UR61_9GAMM|nr:nicotinate-nucleotide adenylyltransferase [Spongiibacter nanhainus]QQD18893.1 nicotinate-nucleotide adenylyltransferase [Spongiibacter nanhainus]